MVNLQFYLYKIQNQDKNPRVIILGGGVCGSIDEKSECGMLPGGGHSAS